jgi:hypothetical protein
MRPAGASSGRARGSARRPRTGNSRAASSWFTAGWSEVWVLGADELGVRAVAGPALACRRETTAARAGTAVARSHSACYRVAHQGVR